MDDIGRGGCLSQRQYDLIVRFLSQGYFPTKRELMDANFASSEDTIRPRPFRKFKSWTQRLLYRESENALIHLPTGKVVVPKENFLQIILTNHCNETGGHLTAYATMRKIQKKYTFGRRNFGMNEELVRNVIRNCSFCENIRPKTIKSDTGFDVDKTRGVPYFLACNQNKQEKHLGIQTEKSTSTMTIPGSQAVNMASVAQTPDSLKQVTANYDNERQLMDTAMEWKSEDVNNNKADVKQSHPIIHNTLLSQVKSAGTCTDTSSCKNMPVSFPLLGPIGVSILPSQSNINHLATAAPSAKSSANTRQISLTSTHSLLARDPFITIAKSQEMKSDINSLMTQRPTALGCYVKMPNSTSPSGFSISYVSAPIVSLNHSTVCSPSLASLPKSSDVAPLQVSSDGSAAKKDSIADKAEITVSQSQSQTAGSNLPNRNEIVITPDQLKPKAKKPISIKPNNQPKSLPPIKPKEETELAKALLNSEDSSPKSSGVSSTPDKQNNVSKKDASTGVLKKLKMRLHKLGKKVKRIGKQNKIASSSSGKKNDEKDVNDENEKEDKTNSLVPVDESHQKKKVIVINPEKMKKILENSLRGMNMNINFKGKCNVIFHNESSGTKTCFKVDEALSAGFTMSSTQEETSNKSMPSGKKEVETSVKEKSLHEKQQCDDLIKARPVIAEQVMKEYLGEKENNLIQDVNGLVSSTSTKPTDKTNLHSLLPNPGSIPCPSIWTFSADMTAERNCYRRLLIAIQDMRKDIMKSILSDHNAIERLRKKIGYAESLINKHKAFISSYHKDLDLN